MGMIKKIWRYLVDNNLIFTKMEAQRYSCQYPYKELNSNYKFSNPTIHFIHKYVTSNTGDRACGYYRYFLSSFQEYRCVVHDISHVHFSIIKNSDIVIIGGGGLLNALSEWNYTINKVARIAKKSIIWSAGFNSKMTKNIKLHIEWNRFRLISIRDFRHPSNFQYVPCATCMIPYLNDTYEINREIGVVFHEYKRNIPSEFKKYDSIANSSPLKDIINFIGSSEIILTNSYHAAYWSILMKKKCIIFSLESEKFNYFQYKPTLYTGNLFADINNSVVYVNALQNCRLKVYGYLKDVMALIENTKI